MLGVLAGNDLIREMLTIWAASASLILAADGGADALLKSGHFPHHVIGDMDSISEEGRSLKTIHHADIDQEKSDTDKLLGYATNLGCESITLIGVEGDLLDHVLGTLASALRSSLRVRFALRRGIAHLVRSKESYQLKATPGARVSLLPLENCQNVCLSGVEWPLVNAEGGFSSGLSLSNRARSENLDLSIGIGAAILFVEQLPSIRAEW